MNARLTTISAIVAFVALKMVRFTTYIGVAVVLVLIIATALAAFKVSAWFWLLLLPLLLFFAVGMLLRKFIVFIIAKIYRHPFTREQRLVLDSFTTKVIGLTEVRSTPLPIFALITIKDLLLHRDATFLKKIVTDTGSLRDDLRKIETLFDPKVK